MVARLLQGCGYSNDGGVVGLRAAAGEHHLAGAAVEHPRHPLAGLVERVTRFLAHSVDAGRIAEKLGEIWRHRPQHLRRQRSSASVVHVNDTDVPVSCHIFQVVRIVSG